MQTLLPGKAKAVPASRIQRAIYESIVGDQLLSGINANRNINDMEASAAGPIT